MVIFLSETRKNLFQLVFEPDFDDPDFDLDRYLEPARSCAHRNQERPDDHI